jgi:hypothetical protein
LKLTLHASAGTFGTRATPALKGTLREKPLGQVTMIDIETLGSLSLTVSVPPFGEAAGLGLAGDDDDRLLLLLLRRRLDDRLGFSGGASSSASPVSCGALRRRFVGG